MPGALAILIGAVALMWGAALSSWKLRNWRTILFLVAVSSLLIAVGWLPAPLSAIAQVVGWLAGLLFVGTLGDRWLVMDKSQVRFASEYARVLQRIGDLKETAATDEPTGYIAKFDRIIEELGALQPPTAEWAALRDDTIRELEARSVVMKVGIEPSSEALTDGAVRWAAIEQRFDDLLHSLRQSWLLLRVREPRT